MEGGKSGWPEVVGKSGEEAKGIILQDDATTDVHVVPEGSPVTRDFRMNRVRVYVDTNGVVVQVPRRG